MSVQPESLVTIGGKRPKKRLSAAQRKKRRKKQKMAANRLERIKNARAVRCDRFENRFAFPDKFLR